MKKLTAILLALICIILPVTAHAEPPAFPMMGDINGDGRITAADARSLLRYSAKLETTGNFDLLAADANADGRITAADARETLRVAASLSRFAVGFNKDGEPNAVNLIKNRSFIMDAVIKDGKENTDIVIAIRGKDICILYNTNSSAIPVDGNMSNLGLVFTDGRFYCTCNIDDSKFGFLVPEEMLNDLFSDEFSIEDMENIIYMAVADDIGAPTAKTENGKTVYEYNYKSNGESFILQTNAYGVPTKIFSHNSNSSSVIVNSLTYANLDSYFDLSDYTIM